MVICMNDSIIQTRDLHFAYTTAEGAAPTVLDGVDIAIEEGSFVAVLGHNGSGKSTLAKHMNAILVPSEGKVTVNGIDTADEERLIDIRRSVGMVFQNPDNQIVANVVEDDVAFAPENLGVPPTEIRQRVDAALKQVGMFEYREHAPHLLSGGQKQRVAIAGVIAMEPKIIVLDEPTAMLDPLGRSEVISTITRLCRGVPVNLPTEDNHFQVDPEALKAAITDKTKAIILTSPNNPTGCIYTKETLDTIHDILVDKPIFVLCDDVYRTLVYTEDYHSFSEYQDMRDRIIVINSFSKPYAMTGWRLGYCLADAPIRDRMQIFHQYMVVSAPSFVQPACVAALESDTSGMVEIFRKRRDYVYKRLTDMGLEVQEPEGAFYMFINIKKYGMDSLTFCEKMLKEGLVGLIPGCYFDCEGYMRLSYCYSDEDLKEGLDRIEKFIKTL